MAADPMAADPMAADPVAADPMAADPVIDTATEASEPLGSRGVAGGVTGGDVGGEEDPPLDPADPVVDPPWEGCGAEEEEGDEGEGDGLKRATHRNRRRPSLFVNGGGRDTRVRGRVA